MERIAIAAILETRPFLHNNDIYVHIHINISIHEMTMVNVAAAGSNYDRHLELQVNI